MLYRDTCTQERVHTRGAYITVNEGYKLKSSGDGQSLKGAVVMSLSVYVGNKQRAINWPKPEYLLIGNVVSAAFGKRALPRATHRALKRTLR